ncbi:hypothetical protein B0T16DRAFT_452863 [Cercophora newfieldiana]|uniref:Secreted protein n=1 Tax=Cercophora newfieldiana TaxID=92897 RepID=A0AA40CZN8_9PEZI|nr:hypothetical protein B0T16DRAFT_452863 [Cercophora newfieldiana]
MKSIAAITIVLLFGVSASHDDSDTTPRLLDDHDVAPLASMTTARAVGNWHPIYGTLSPECAHCLDQAPFSCPGDPSSQEYADCFCSQDPCLKTTKPSTTILVGKIWFAIARR